MSLRRSALSLALLAAAPLGIALAAASGARAQSPAPLPVPALKWVPCGGEFPGLECARVQVPLDYDQPEAESIELALVRHPASSPEQRIGALFVNPGGPGGSAVDTVLHGFGEALGAALGGRFDIVGIDPRGVARSEPLRCFASNEERAAFFADQIAFPYRREQQRPYFEGGQTLTELCAARGQRILAHMSTADVARDMDLVRSALGDEQLSYLGLSYGSFLGTTYAQLFPQRVRALVIDGVLDPRLWSRGWQISADRVALQQEFDEFLRLCDEAGADCALGGPQGAGARYEALAAALLEVPLELPERLYSYDVLISDTSTAMYAPDTWGGPDGYGALFDMLADAALGDREAHSRAGALRKALEQRLREARPPRREDEYDNRVEGYLGNHCSDARYPRSFQEWRGIDHYARSGSRFGPLWWWTNVPCASWPEAEDRYLGPWNARTAAPSLVVGNYFDGVTAYTGAQAASRLLGGRLLSYAGWGHLAFGRSACATSHVLRYLATGVLPPEGTVCPANPNPFQELEGLRARETRSLPWLGLPPAQPGSR